MESCLAAQKRFLLFKGLESMKKKFKIGGNVEEVKAYQLIPLATPPPRIFNLPYHFIKEKK
jgi:hypothetical protein